MALVLAGAGIDQNRVARRADHEGLVGDDHHAARAVEHLRLHPGQMMLEDSLDIGRKEILRPAPWPFAFDHRVDGDVADPELFQWCSPVFAGTVTGGYRQFKAAAVGGRRAQCRLKYCTSRSCFSAAARDLKVPRLRRLPVLGSVLRE